MTPHSRSCAWCKKVLINGRWVHTNPLPVDKVTHGICTPCADKYFPKKEKPMDRGLVSRLNAIDGNRRRVHRPAHTVEQRVHDLHTVAIYAGVMALIAGVILIAEALTWAK